MVNRQHDLGFERVLPLRSEENEESESYRPVRNDRFRELLDEEFQRSYRFETLGNIFNDVKEFFRKVVTREEEEGELEFSDTPLGPKNKP